MNLIEALRTGKPIRRNRPKFVGSHGDGWMDNYLIRHTLLSFFSLMHMVPSWWLDEDDLLADDWEVRDEK